MPLTVSFSEVDLSTETRQNILDFGWLKNNRSSSGGQLEQAESSDADQCSAPQASTMSQLARPLRQAVASVRLGRLVNTSAALQSNDPIQKLFVDKLRAYGEKSK